MNAQIIPSINAPTFEEVVRRIRLSEPYAKWVHIDVSDGTFTSTAVWHNAGDLANFKSPCKIEIHYMIDNPDEHASDWFLPCVSRFIFHQENAKDPHAIIKACHASGKQAGIAIVPDTSWETLKEFVGHADLLQTLAVTPGPSGQSFDPRAIEKLRRLRACSPDIILEVDGGISHGIARECADAGANALVVGAALFNRGVPFGEAYKDLTNEILR